jgi:hypothetical protein
MTPLSSIARVIRSKNCSPFVLTLDIVFRSEEYYRAVEESGCLTRETIARAYGVAVERVESLTFFAPALAVKATLRRTVPSGSPGDSDVYGAQQHGPLLRLELPLRVGV